MYIYYDKNYNLKEFITDVKAFQSASEVNNLYVYVEDLEDDDYSNATVRYKNYGTIDDKNKEIYVSNEYSFDGTEEKEIPFNREQDLLFFQYGKTYKFIKFVIPDEVLAENGVVLATIRLITEKTIQPLELLTFNVFNEVVAKDVGITLSQWNYLLKRLYLSGKFIKVVEDIGILNNNYDDYNDRDVIFDEKGQNFYLVLEVNGVKTIRLLLTRKSENSVNTIIVRDDKGKAEIETPVKDEDGSKSIVNIEYVNKVVEDLTLRNDVVDVVGTYQDLQSYDTSKLTVNDVIKVLQDNTHDDASTYYKWNGTSFDFIGEEGPYYTQTQVDEKLDTKLDKVENTGFFPKAYVTTNTGQDTLSVSYAYANGAIPRYSGNGTLSVNTPTAGDNATNKDYVDGRFDYVVLTNSRFVKNTSLDETDRQLLLDFYNKHYGKTNIPLFAIDKDGVIATIALKSITTIEFYVWSSDQSPIVFKIQPSLSKRTFSMFYSGYLHEVLGQDVWENSVYARIGINSNNQLIITDTSGNQTPGQSPSVLVPPFTLASNGYYILNENFEVKNLDSSSASILNDLFIGSPDSNLYIQQAMNYSDSSFQIRCIKLNNGSSPTLSFYTFKIGEEFGGTVATLNDLDNKLDIITYDKELSYTGSRGTLPDDLKALILPYYNANKPFILKHTYDDVFYYLKAYNGNANGEVELYYWEVDTQNQFRLLINLETNTFQFAAYIYPLYDDVVQAENNKKVLYANDENGQQAVIPYSLLPDDSNIAQFDTNGHLYTNDPSIETHCTNKKYVDNLYFEHIITVKGNTAYALIKKISKTKTAITSYAEMITLLGLQADEIYPCHSGYISGNYVTNCIKYDGTKTYMGWIGPTGEFKATDTAGFVSDLVKPL